MFNKALLSTNDEITVFTQLPHTHNTGVSLFSSVVRNGTEIENIANNKYFDNKFQVNFEIILL